MAVKLPLNLIFTLYNVIFFPRFRQGLLDTKVRSENLIPNKQLLFYILFKVQDMVIFPTTEMHSQKKINGHCNHNTAPRPGYEFPTYFGHESSPALRRLLNTLYTQQTSEQEDPRRIKSTRHTLLIYICRVFLNYCPVEP